MAEAAAQEPLKKLPLDALWRARAKKWGAFAGYDMPLEFEGLIAEHIWTRTRTGLFDVSHMGPCFLKLRTARPTEQGEHDGLAAIIEQLVPADIKALKPGQVRYTTLVNTEGGVLDDLMIARPPSPERGFLHIVVNAGTKHADFDMIAQASGEAARLEIASGWSLLALQGPQAAEVAAAHFPDWTRLSFMTLGVFDDAEHGALFVTRSGYTGEDGFEILVRNEHAAALTETLLTDERVKPVGLGARDTLRLEAGLCLYGHDLDPTISPIEADLGWTIQKRRRESADFPGAERMLAEIRTGPVRKRVGIRPRDRAPAREGVEIHKDGRKIGVVTSGGFSPTLNAPISMGYVDTAFSAPGTELELIVRGQKRPAEVVHLPFVPHRYARKS